ncbi:hypothetical protein B0H19DRAFT_1056632 [Mycena capillaripes]|nr:hypothetical protein B0H19DRAFT_1056632 [Mycena capillaripes]
MPFAVLIAPSLLYCIIMLVISARVLYRLGGEGSAYEYLWEPRLALASRSNAERATHGLEGWYGDGGAQELAGISLASFKLQLLLVFSPFSPERSLAFSQISHDASGLRLGHSVASSASHTPGLDNSLAGNYAAGLPGGDGGQRDATPAGAACDALAHFSTSNLVLKLEPFIDAFPIMYLAQKDVEAQMISATG